MSDWNNFKAPPYDCLAFSWATQPPCGEVLGALSVPLKEIDRESKIRGRGSHGTGRIWASWESWSFLGFPTQPGSTVSSRECLSCCDPSPSP